jgi:uncharacterized protein YkwD
VPFLSTSTLACILLISQPAKPPVDLELSREEQTILDLTNKARSGHNLPPLRPDARLFKAARSHSANMAEHKKMSHVLDGKKAAARVLEAGYRFQVVGENIAYSSGPTDVQAVFDGWMRSSGHRENILRRTYRDIGIGVAEAPDGTMYYTQVFGARQRTPGPKPRPTPAAISRR